MVLPEEEKDVLLKAAGLKKIALTSDELSDVSNIAKGVYSPLTGFLRKADFETVVSDTRLKSGIVWPIPITLDISEDEYKEIQNEKNIALTDVGGDIIGLLENIEIFNYDKEVFAKNVFGTSDISHPGVASVFKMGDRLVGGDIRMIEGKKEIFPEHNFSPNEMRKIFASRGWEKVVAFQTRNVPHPGHEFLQKEALKLADGLLVQPVIGEKKVADFKDEYIIASYELLIDKFYPKDKTLLGILMLKMRYAGPKEAVFHAIIRKNFGCTHFIVGRDHAGVGSFYSPFAAQEIFDNFKKDEIEIEILKFPEVVFCKSTNSHEFINNCDEADRVAFSGTKLRGFIENKEKPPEYILRPEIYNLLVKSHNCLVDNMYKNQTGKKQKGFVLWFTGLSQSGKTTIANGVYETLKEQGYKIERLDGDVVREYLWKDLGFSKEDRDENIRRIGFLSKLLSKNGVGVIASFISPYKQHRAGVKDEVENFIEVFCNCPIEICEKRDTKGLYEKAKRGEVTNFTGVSDPYEPPENPDIELKTETKEDIERSVTKIISHLKENDYIQ